MGTKIKEIYVSRKIALDNEGLRIGVDFSLYLKKYLAVYKTLSGNPFTVTYKDKEVITSHLYGFIKNFFEISKNNKLAFILDWNFSLDIKKKTREDRQKKNQERQDRITEYLKDPKTFELAKKQIFSRTNYEIDYELVFEIFEDLGWTIIKAEVADAEKYGANLVKKGYLDYFITSDSDTLLFGSDYVKSFSVNNGKLFLEVVSLEDTLYENNLTTTQLIQRGIISGTDYHPGIPGIGAVRSEKYLEEKGFDDSLIPYFNYFIEELSELKEIQQISLKETNIDNINKWKWILKIR